MIDTATYLLSKRAELTPAREALLDLGSGTRYSYAALNARANRAAHWLHALGVGYGDRVSLLALNSVVFVDLLFACGKLGAVFTPLNWRLAAPELVYIVGHSRPRVIVYGSECAPLVAVLRPAFDSVLFVAQEEYAQAITTHSSDEPPRPAALNAESPHAILYTSGTTGRPKGALIPQRQVLWNAINTVISWGLTADDCAPILTPMFHAGGLFVFLTPLFYVGGRVVIGANFEPAQALNVIARERCSVILGVPTIFQMWLASPALAAVDLSHVRFFISGGAPCPVALIEAWHTRTGCVLRQGYGLSEVGTNCFTMTDAEAIERAGSVGHPIFHSQMRLVDADGRDVAPGATGELIIKGPHVCSGYLDNAEATAAALRDGWFYTGDMARQDADGYYYIAGRFKDMLISGGENVYAAEVEAVFMDHPAVRDCALIGEPDPTWGEVGLLIVVLHANQTTDGEALLAHGRARLARYKLPKRIIFAAELPHSPYGKVEKLKLKAQYVAAPAGAAHTGA